MTDPNFVPQPYDPQQQVFGPYAQQRPATAISSAPEAGHQVAPRVSPVPGSQPVLSARGLTRSYGATIALSGVDLDIYPGQSVAIMGPSGSGKSTLLHALAGIERPDSGTVHFQTRAGNTQEIAQLGERDRSRLRRELFGFVFQSGLLIPELTAIENVAMALMINGTPKSAALPQAAQWLGALGLATMAERRIGQLSGGEAQRVAIARAQVTGAQVTFADEPTGALDSATGFHVLQVLLDSTVGRGNTLVMVTHDADVAARCDRIVRLRDGQLLGPVQS